jgi:outer membrane protein assembly factor BamB
VNVPHLSLSVLVSGDLVFAKTARTLYALRLLDGAVVWTFTPHRAKGEHMYSTPVISGERLYTGDRAGSMPTAEGAMVSSAGRKVGPSARHPPKGEVPDAVWLRARGRGRPA